MENENKNPQFMKVDDNKIININTIRWVKKKVHLECFHICTKSTGCSKGDVHEVCKKNNMENYLKLNQYFE